MVRGVSGTHVEVLPRRGGVSPRESAGQVQTHRTAATSFSDDVEVLHLGRGPSPPGAAGIGSDHDMKADRAQAASPVRAGGAVVPAFAAMPSSAAAMTTTAPAGGLFRATPAAAQPAAALRAPVDAASALAGRPVTLEQVERLLVKHTAAIQDDIRQMLQGRR